MRRALSREPAKLPLHDARVLSAHSAALSHMELLVSEAPAVATLSGQGLRYFEAHQYNRTRRRETAAAEGSLRVSLWKTLIRLLIVVGIYAMRRGFCSSCYKQIMVRGGLSLRPQVFATFDRSFSVVAAHSVLLGFLCDPAPGCRTAASTT